MMYSIEQYELTDPKQVYVSVYNYGDNVEVYLENDQQTLAKQEIFSIREAIELAANMGVPFRFAQ
jgi:hypothetical protein|nr:MAG TPA: hypothetical protein [Caudoviricetes sp.]